MSEHDTAICSGCGRIIEYYPGHWASGQSAYWFHADPYPDSERHEATPMKPTPPKPLEAFENRDHRQECQLRYITADEARLRSFGCTCPKPLESPQEQCPRCYSAVRYVRLWISAFTGNCTNPWHDSPEPKPAPRAEEFEEWWAENINRIHSLYRGNDLFTYKDLMKEAWSSAQTPLLQKIAELEGQVKVLRGALIYIGRKVGCLLSDEVSTGFIATGVPGEVNAKLERHENALSKAGSDAFTAQARVKELESQLEAAKVEGFNEGIEAAISVADKHGHARLNSPIKMGKRDQEDMERMAAQCLLISVDLKMLLPTVADSNRGEE